MLLDGKKLSCASCIKGHRSSGCTHSSRPLIEIKKKGRPVTQCEHCRELRKTKQVHVKCLCEFKPPEGSDAPSTGGKVEPPDDTPSCECKTTGPCNCCTPRKSTRPSQNNEDPPEPPTLRRRATISHHHPPPKILPSESTQPTGQAPTLPAPRAQGSNDRLCYPRHHSNHSHNYNPYPPPRRPASTGSEPEFSSPSQTPQKLDCPLGAWDWLNSSKPNPSPTDDALTSDEFNSTPRLAALHLGMILTCRCGSNCACSSCAEHATAIAATMTDVGPISCPDCYFMDESQPHGDFTFNFYPDQDSVQDSTSGLGIQGDAGNVFADMSAFLRPPSPHPVSRVLPCMTGSYSLSMSPMISPNSSNPPSIGGSSTSRSSSRNSSHSIGEYRRILPRPSIVPAVSPSLSSSSAPNYRGRQAPAHLEYQDTDGSFSAPAFPSPAGQFPDHIVNHASSPTTLSPYSAKADNPPYFAPNSLDFEHDSHFAPWHPSPWGSPTIAPFVPTTYESDDSDLPSLYHTSYPSLGYSLDEFGTAATPSVRF